MKKNCERRQSVTLNSACATLARSGKVKTMPKNMIVCASDALRRSKCAQRCSIRRELRPSAALLCSRRFAQSSPFSQQSSSSPPPTINVEKHRAARATQRGGCSATKYFSLTLRAAIDPLHCWKASRRRPTTAASTTATAEKSKRAR